MASCRCEAFEHLEFYSSAISQRITDTKALLKQLTLLASDATDWHRLYRCPECGQQWQVSRAWNWDRGRYAFRVPAIPTEEWVHEQYVAPDELLIFAASVQQLPEPEASTNHCREPGCPDFAIVFGVFCQRHHMQQLQAVSQFPKYPSGKWFPPYTEFPT